MTRDLPTAYLAEAQGWRCCYCTLPMLSMASSRHEKRAVLGQPHRFHRGIAAAMRVVTRDHLTPRCDGGTDTRANLVAACRWCNAYRGNRPADEAFLRVQRLIARGTHPHQVWQFTGRFPRMTPLRNVLRAAPAPLMETRI